MLTTATYESTSWPDGLIQLLDDHHVVVLCDDAVMRGQVCKTIGEHLRALPESRAIEVNCAGVCDLPSFCRQLEPHFDRPPGASGGRAGGAASGVTPWWRDINSVIDLLRSSAGGPDGCKREYFIWQEAQAMLEADVALFSALVNAFLGVAAEREHISADRLLIQRVVFMGGAKLGAYAEDPKGQFCSWLEDEDGSPFWEVINVVDRPAVIAYRVNG